MVMMIIFTLKIIEEHHAPLNMTPQEGHKETIRVLHVDDQLDFAEMATTFLERENDRFETETVASASDGLVRLADSSFDCVISDYEMPEQNGIELLRTVRREWPDLPFILFTGKGSEKVASEAISAGVTDYLQKSSGTEQYELLAHRITNAVEHHS
jgi:PAS/PAC sensor hybrid histidine kinase (EC 2.7.13.3)